MTDPIVIVGGGLAAGTAVTELRDQGYDGPVVVFTDEAHLPYERPPLSKAYLMGKDPLEKAFVHDAAWYDEHGVDVRTSTRVDAIDPPAKQVRAGDETLPYRGLLLATGARPRRLAMADESGAPVTYLRTIDHSTALREQLRPEQRIGIIGGGWIGLEVAAAAREAGAHVTILEALDQPLQRVLGDEVGAIFADVHRSHGVDVRTGVRITGIDQVDDAVFVGVGDGHVEVDHLVVGVGVEPVTELAQAAGLEVDNGIRTDAGLLTSASGVYAAGDVANADHPVLGYPLRVEHWDTAIKHGKVAAANLLGGAAVADSLPYFFTDQYDLGMEYVGNPGPAGFDSVEIEGDPASGTWRAWWLRGDLVVAGMHVNDWDAIDEVRRRVGSVRNS